MNKVKISWLSLIIQTLPSSSLLLKKQTILIKLSAKSDNTYKYFQILTSVSCVKYFTFSPLFYFALNFGLKNFQKEFFLCYNVSLKFQSSRILLRKRRHLCSDLLIEIITNRRRRQDGNKKEGRKKEGKKRTWKSERERKCLLFFSVWNGF